MSILCNVLSQTCFRRMLQKCSQLLGTWVIWIPVSAQSHHLTQSNTFQHLRSLKASFACQDVLWGVVRPQREHFLVEREWAVKAPEQDALDEGTRCMPVAQPHHNFHQLLQHQGMSRMACQAMLKDCACHPPLPTLCCLHSASHANH